MRGPVTRKGPSWANWGDSHTAHADVLAGLVVRHSQGAWTAGSWATGLRERSLVIFATFWGVENYFGTNTLKRMRAAPPQRGGNARGQATVTPGAGWKWPVPTPLWRGVFKPMEKTPERLPWVLTSPGCTHRAHAENRRHPRWLSWHPRAAPRWAQGTSSMFRHRWGRGRPRADAQYILARSTLAGQVVANECTGRRISRRLTRKDRPACDLTRVLGVGPKHQRREARHLHTATETLGTDTADRSHRPQVRGRRSQW